MDASRVRLVPSRWYWVLVGLFGLCLVGLGFTCLSPNPHTDANWRTEAASILAALFAFPISFVIWMYVAYIEADDAGLHWRTFRGTRSAAWLDVSDYYLRSSVKNGATQTFTVIVTKKGKIRIDENWTGQIEAFRALVQKHAVGAKAHSWDRLGMRRDVDWPRTFAYNSADERKIAVVLSTLMAAYWILWLWMLWPKIPRSLSEPAAGWTIACLLLALVPVAKISAFAIIILGARQRSRTFWKDTITVSDQGLALSRDERFVRIAWLEISNYYLDEKSGIREIGSGRGIVESAAGKRIEFSLTISERPVLLATIQRESTSARSIAWKNIRGDAENLDLLASKWTGGADGHGTRLFHYRTRSNRALLAMMTVMACSVFARPTVAGLGLIEPVPFPIIYFWIAASLLTWTIWRYHAGGIAINAYGITERTPFGDRTIDWPSVARVRSTGDDIFRFGIISAGSGRTVRCWLGISDARELEQELRRRAPRARFDWDTKPLP